MNNQIKHKYIKHLITISKHKYYVMKYCFKCGQYKRGLLHDLSKFGPTEFLSSAKYFSGNRSPIDNEKDDIGYSLAWQHHKGHNPHHWEYWIDNVGTYKNTPCKIPYQYAIEMICDWVAAGIVYSKEKVDDYKSYSIPFDYYNSHKDVRIIHPQTDELLNRILTMIEEKGLNATCKYIKNSFILQDMYEDDLLLFDNK